MAEPSWADRLAYGVSCVASPFLVLPCFIGVLLSHDSAGGRQALLWATIAVSGLVGVPALYILGGVRQGKITDLHISRRDQRQGPFMAAIVGAVAAAGLLRFVDAPAAWQLGAVGVALNGGLFAFISRWWKISMHPGTLGACCVLCGMMVSPIWYWPSVLLPLVMWARVRRKRHSWAQGVIATLLASGLTAGMVWSYQHWLGP